MDLGNLPVTKKSKGKGVSKKEQTKKPKKPAIVESDEDDELLELKEQLAKYNLESPTDQTEMETDMMPMRKERSKRAVTKKHASTFTEISDDEEAEFNPMQPIPEEKKTEEDGGDDDEEPEIAAAALKVGKGRGPRGRKPASGNTKAAAMGRKRDVAAQSKPILSQKVITEVLKPGVGDRQVVNSPEKKVRKMRASPFNKKSGSVLGRINNKNNTKDEENSPESGLSPPSNVEELSDVAAPRARPRRENRDFSTKRLVAGTAVGGATVAGRGHRDGTRLATGLTTHKRSNSHYTNSYRNFGNTYP
ncbi:hypothetical protein ACLOJK_014614, partial [Asimina triloba]